MSGDMDVDQPAFRRKGRGFTSGDGAAEDNKDAVFDSLDSTAAPVTFTAPTTSVGTKASRSIEGWIIIITNLHEEASEDDVQDKFGEFGDIKNLHLNLDRRTGYVKGYALVEYETREAALAAITEASGTQLLEQTIACDFAFVRAPQGAPKGGAGGRAPARKEDAKIVTRID